MNNENFSKLTEACLTEIRETLSIKGQEYALGSDRLRNFKDAALFLDDSPEAALFGFVTKHIIALKDFIIGVSDPNDPTTEDQWLEKTGDIAVYLMPLLRGLLIDRGLLPEYAERIGINESDS